MTLLMPHPPQESPAEPAAQPIAGLAHASELAGSLDAGCRPASGSGCRRVLIVASDGLWEWLSNATAVSIAAAAGSGEAGAAMWGGRCGVRYAAGTAVLQQP